MKRVIVNYHKLTPEVLSLLVSKYPHGYDDGHIITFTNHKNETIEAVEIRTEDTVYLVKVSTKLANRMVDFSMKEYASTEVPQSITEIPGGGDA